MATYNFGDTSYGIDLTGSTDSTTALNAAWASVPTGSKVYLPSTGVGVKLSATVTVKPDCEFYSDGWDPITIQRDSDYGDTFVVGDNTSIAAGSCVFRDMALIHGSSYVAGATTLKAKNGTTAMKATSGAHIRTYGSQHSLIKNVRAWRMPYQVYHHGGSLFYAENNAFIGVWDDLNTGCQEGVAQMVYDVSTKWGNPQLACHKRNQFAGPVSASRTINYNGVNASVNSGIGSKQGLLIHGMEVATFDSDYFGSMNSNAVAYQGVANSFTTDNTFSNCYFDSTTSDQIYVKPDDNASIMYNFTVDNCGFNGQWKGISCIFILPANGGYPGNTPSVYGLTISNNSMGHMPASALRILGAKNFRIYGNRIFDYNYYNSSTTDVQWCAAGWVDWQSAVGQIHDNQTGGGGKQMLAQHSNGNNAWVGWQTTSGTSIVVDRDTHITPV